MSTGNPRTKQLPLDVDLPVAPGRGVDSAGGPVVDPTINVIALTEAANRRQDDLREAEQRVNDLRDAHLREMAELRAEHMKELAVKESSRLDSIRQVDREEVTKTAAANNLAISTLAKQTTDLATTLSTQVQVSAQAAEARRQADKEEVIKRVSALELALSASAGRSTIADPALADLATEVRKLVASRDEISGKTAVVDPQFVTMMAELKVLREKENTRTGFDAGKLAALTVPPAIAAGAVALIMKLAGH